jgi:hypothetical protein
MSDTVRRSTDRKGPSMATNNEVQDALLDRINELASKATNTTQALVVVRLAEAYAWVTRADQPHGSSGG